MTTGRWERWTRRSASSAHHVVIATRPGERSTWLQRGVVSEARDRHDVTIQHVVVHEPVPG